MSEQEAAFAEGAKEFVGAFQIFAYFGVTLIALQYVNKAFEQTASEGAPR